MNKNDITFLSFENFAKGIVFFVIGLSKKIIFANTLATYADVVFAKAASVNFIEAWIGTLAFTLELYFDFSGYSDMVVGIGKMLNLEYPFNFDAPYRANSVKEFWKKWHISLSAWISRYIYIPLGGNRKGEARKYLNLIIAMIISGLWHGARWTFIFWGFLHGIYLVIYNLWCKRKVKLPIVLSRIITFMAVTVGWVFFRADTFQDAVFIIKKMLDFGNIILPEHYISRLGWLSGIVHFGKMNVAFSVLEAGFLITMLLIVVTIIPCSQKIVEMLSKKRKYLLFLGVLTGLMFGYILLTFSVGSSSFMYSNF